MLEDKIANVVMNGDLSKLNERQRYDYQMELCHSLKINPFTKPFEYIPLNGKLQLYATKGCTDQLRKLYGVSIQIVKTWDYKGVYFVQVKAFDKNGREDMATGFANVGNFGGDHLGNAMLKAETKAKRRVTLSICGLGAFMCEEEAEDVTSDEKQGPEKADNKQIGVKTTRTSSDVEKHLEMSDMAKQEVLDEQEKNK